MMAVGIETKPEFSVSKPSVLFTGHYETSFITPGYRFYDVFPDGERFLMVKSENSSGSTELNLVENWTEEVQRLTPRGKGCSTHDHGSNEILDLAPGQDLCLLAALPLTSSVNQPGPGGDAARDS